MSIPVIVVISAKNCGACAQIMGPTGILMASTDSNKAKTRRPFPGGHYYDEIFLRKLITGQMSTPENGAHIARFQVFNLKLRDYGTASSIGDAVEFSEFTINSDGSIRQVVHSEEEGKDAITVYNISSKTVKTVETKKPSGDWHTLVKGKFPAALASYFYFFPMITVFNGVAWNKALRSSVPLYGYLLNAKAQQTSPYGIDRDSVSQVPEDPAAFINGFASGMKPLLEAPEGTPVATPAASGGAGGHEGHGHGSEGKTGSIMKKLDQDEIISIPTAGSCKSVGVFGAHPRHGW
jgi:hypothetical protein